MAPGATLLLVRKRLAFDLACTVGAGVPVLEWDADRPANGREKTHVNKPAAAGDADGPWIRVDRVVYSDGANPQDFATGVDPWPARRATGAKSFPAENLLDRQGLLIYF